MHGCDEEVVPIPAINGRPVISRADMAARGVPSSTVSGWYRDRARTGHPEKAGRIGRTDYWYEDEWTAWHQAYQRGKTESLTQVDRGGDPDDLVDAAEAARMLRYASRYVIHANRRLGYFPEPDAYGPGPPGPAHPAVEALHGLGRGRPPPGQGGGRKPGTPGPPSPTRTPVTSDSTESWPTPFGARPSAVTWPRSGASAGAPPSGSSARPGPSSSSRHQSEEEERTRVAP